MTRRRATILLHWLTCVLPVLLIAGGGTADTPLWQMILLSDVSLHGML